MTCESVRKVDIIHQKHNKRRRKRTVSAQSIFFGRKVDWFSLLLLNRPKLAGSD